MFECEMVLIMKALFQSQKNCYVRYNGRKFILMVALPITIFEYSLFPYTIQYSSLTLLLNVKVLAE